MIQDETVQAADGDYPQKKGSACKVWEAAFNHEQNLLRRIAVGMGLSRLDVDDVLQDVYLAALKQPEKYRKPEDLRGWLVRVTVNLCTLEYRRRKRFRQKAKEILKRRLGNKKAAENPAQQAIRQEELEAVQLTLRHLDETLLAPLVLKYFCDLNSNEIGETLQLNSSTVRSRLRDGRIKLAQKLRIKGIKP